MNSPMMDALYELDREIGKRGLEDISLNVVGGFALMLHEYRSMDGMTDIDYIGSNLPSEIKAVSDQIGIQHHLGTGWINNDLMLTGTTPEELEFSTGKLHFSEAIHMEHIQINVLDQKDLLRMKVISIDTALSAVDNGGDFTRTKDLPDIIRLADGIGMSFADMEHDFSDYIINPKTIDLLRAFDEKGLDALKDFLNKNEPVQKSGEPEHKADWSIISQFMPAGAFSREARSEAAPIRLEDLLERAIYNASTYNSMGDQPCPNDDAR